VRFVSDGKRYGSFAKACGGTGMAIEDPMDCGRILDRALATPGPVIVEAIVDPFTPPMPAKITLEQSEEVCRIPRPRRTKPFKNCLDRAFRQSTRTYLTVK
jgi:thiamine pyrophosphate-dependent acetolactate synthase large subunit-like protein